MSCEARLLCPHDNTALNPVAGYDILVRCPQCEYECPNYILYPVEAVMDRHGEISYRNVLTGDPVEV